MIRTRRKALRAGVYDRPPLNALGVQAEEWEPPGSITLPAEDSEKMYRLALRGYWGLGDYPSITGTQGAQRMLADILLQKERFYEVQRLIDDSLFFAQHENDDGGSGLTHFVSICMHERMSNHESATTSYESATNMAVKAGDFWLEAGSLQGLVHWAHSPGRYAEHDTITQAMNHSDGSVRCKERLGGLLKYYHRKPHAYFDQTRE
jgi:hypothetical protein